MADDAAQDAWVTRVLGIDPARSPGLVQSLAQSAERGREAKAANPRGIAYPKLLLRWRAAQARLADSLNDIAKDILGRDEVLADPRVEEVRQCAALLPTLVPTFGSALEDAIDAGINEGEGPRAQEHAAQALAIIDAYREQVAAAVALKELDAFVAGELGSGLALGAELDSALASIRAELASVA